MSAHELYAEARQLQEKADLTRRIAKLTEQNEKLDRELTAAKVEMKRHHRAASIFHKVLKALEDRLPHTVRQPLAFNDSVYDSPVGRLTWVYWRNILEPEDEKALSNVLATIKEHRKP